MRKVIFQINYDNNVLLSMADAQKLAELLDGAQLVGRRWIGEHSVDYTKDEAYTAALEFTKGNETYLTETEIAELELAEATAEAEQEEA